MKEAKITHKKESGEISFFDVLDVLFGGLETSPVA
jgi:hypothetical protein